MSDGEAQRLAKTQEDVGWVNERIAGLPDMEFQVMDVAMKDLRTLHDAFAAFDADGDGKLTEEEVVAALTRKTSSGTELSEVAARATWQRWVREFDVNEDGKVSIEELTSVIEKLGAFFPSD